MQSNRSDFDHSILIIIGIIWLTINYQRVYFDVSYLSFGDSEILENKKSNDGFLAGSGDTNPDQHSKKQPSFTTSTSHLLRMDALFFLEKK